MTITVHEYEGQTNTESVPDMDMASFNVIKEMNGQLNPSGTHMSECAIGRSVHGRVVTMESADSCSHYSPTPSKHVKMTSYQSSAASKNYLSNSVNTLCEQLKSIEMNDCIDCKKEVFNKVQSPCRQDVCRNGEAHVELDVNAVYKQDRDGDTLLHIAIILLEATVAVLCINMASSHTLLSIRNVIFQMPLHLAVLTNQIAVVRRLVIGGADIESRDKDGNTALHIACREGLSKIAETLLEPVRYIETRQNKYEIPYQRIPQNLDLMNYDGVDCLHLAASNGHLEIVEILIDKGVNINSKEGKTGRTILHNACLDGNLDLVKRLLQVTDCNINARAYDGYTPFDFARARGHNSIIMELAAAGARYGDEDDEE